MDLPLLTARIAERTVRYAVAGRREAPNLLVLVHAYPLGVRMWEPQLAAAADASGPFGADWRMVAVALPGFDGNDPPGEASMDAYARHVLAVLDREAPAETAALCGLSMGAYVAFAILRLAPDRIGRLVLADTRAGADGEEAAAGRRRTLARLAEEGVASIAEDMLPKLLGTTSQRGRPALAARLRGLIQGQSPDTIATATRAMMGRPDSTPLLGTIRVPTLVVVGEEDTLTPPAEAQRINSAIPDARLVQIPEAGHLPNMENPDAFNEALRAFLSGT
jgi:pimeloyl-ACP methyl ester carboxylesterase